MLCPSCRRQLERGASYCGSCGAPLGGAPQPLELVLTDATRVAVVGDMTLGRSPGSSVQLDDPSVSRLHARISDGNGDGARIEDIGSSHGTFVDGVRLTGPMALRDGARIQLGDQELTVERRRDDAEAGRTIVVRAGASLLVSAVGGPAGVVEGTSVGMRPRLRSGYALKRLPADEGRLRWVLRDLDAGTFLRFSDNDAKLVELLDGHNSLADLIGRSETLFGVAGPTRLARLLADLSERGWLAGVAGTQSLLGEQPAQWWRRLLRPREKTWTGLDRVFQAAYRRGGWVLFTRPALIAIAVASIVGLGVFVALIVGRYGTPFVVSEKIGLGALVFLLGRAALVSVHELAHGMAMASYGRRVSKGGFKLLFVFPYAFVDTSEAWFEPRRRRIAISAAGPISDLTLGAVFSIGCLLLEPGTVRDILFQLAFAAYIGAFFNLNPFLDRDGYHMLVDWLREPGLRKRAREQFNRRLSGRGALEDDSPVLARYSAWGVGWLFVMIAFAIFMTSRFRGVMEQFAPSYVVWTLFVTLWCALFIPVLFVVGKPLLERVRGT
jgi:putative peptide zinc metalloprotease protein